MFSLHSLLQNLELSQNCRIFAGKIETMKKESKSYPIIEEEDSSCMTAQESACVAYPYEDVALPDGVAYANIVDGILQVTPDIEEEIAEVERGETVSMTEFKTMFAKWL